MTDRWVEPGGGSVTEGAGRVKADSNGQLSISNAQQSDSGNYTCVASNLAGDMRRNVMVVVSGVCDLNISLVVQGLWLLYSYFEPVLVLLQSINQQ